MDNWREELVAIKARLAVQHMALRALVHSHPDPAAVLATRASAPVAAAPSGSDTAGWDAADSDTSGSDAVTSEPVSDASATGSAVACTASCRALPALPLVRFSPLSTGGRDRDPRPVTRFLTVLRSPTWSPTSGSARQPF